MSEGCEESLQSHRITSLPPSFYYIPDFISEEEEASILQKIPPQRWVTLSHRRLQAIPSTLTKNNTLLASPLPTYLVSPIVDRFKALAIFQETPHQQPNHVLINEYKPGEGIMPHEDGNAYAHVVATVSLGASLCLDVTPKAMGEASEDESQSVGSRDGPTRILQEPRSLLVTTGSAYVDFLHGISPIAADENLGPQSVANWFLLAQPEVFKSAGGRNERGTRISLTYREVLKVSSAASKVFGGMKR